jgi:hypothetical protein
MTAANPPQLAALLVLALAAPGGACATMYKCAVEGGGVYYQDAPCAPGRQLRDFDRDPANVSVVPFAPPPPPVTAKPKGALKADKAAPVPKAAKPAARAAKGSGEAQQRRFLRPGMSEGEVLTRVGAPDVKAKVRKVVRWQYLPVPEDDHTMTTLTFERGAVTDVERKIIR